MSRSKAKRTPGTASARPGAATPRNPVSKRRRRPSDDGCISAFPANVGALGPWRPAPRSAFLSPENFAPQTEVAFEKCPAQHAAGDLTWAQQAESEASRSDGNPRTGRRVAEGGHVRTPPLGRLPLPELTLCLPARSVSRGQGAAERRGLLRTGRDQAGETLGPLRLRIRQEGPRRTSLPGTSNRGDSPPPPTAGTAPRPEQPRPRVGGIARPHRGPASHLGRVAGTRAPVPGPRCPGPVLAGLRPPVRSGTDGSVLSPVTSGAVTMAQSRAEREARPARRLHGDHIPAVIAVTAVWWPAATLVFPETLFLDVT